MICIICLQRMSATDFTWSILEYIVTYVYYYHVQSILWSLGSKQAKEGKFKFGLVSNNQSSRPESVKGNYREK